MSSEKRENRPTTQVIECDAEWQWCLYFRINVIALIVLPLRVH